MSYKNAYVATINLGANMMQAIKTLKEANDHNGPSIVIAYCPCISHGIKGGMTNSLNMEKLAVECGYFLTFRYQPENERFILDSKNPNFDLYDEFLSGENRYVNLKRVNKDNANDILKCQKDWAMKRYDYYKKLENKENN